MSQARSVNANFVAVYALTVSKTGSGAGTVTSDVGAINCGVTCTDNYDDGTSSRSAPQVHPALASPAGRAQAAPERAPAS